MSRRRVHQPGVSFFAFQDIITAVVGIFILITLILVLELVERVESAAAPPTQSTESILENIAILEDEVERIEQELQRRSEQGQQQASLNEFNRQARKEQAIAELSATRDQMEELQAKLRQTRDQHTAAQLEARELAEEAKNLEEDVRLLEELKARTGKMRDRIDHLDADETPVFRDTTVDGRLVTVIELNGAKIDVTDAGTKQKTTFSGARKRRDLEDWLDQHNLSKRQLFLVVKPGGAGDFVALRSVLEDEGALFGYTVASSDQQIRLGFEQP